MHGRFNTSVFTLRKLGGLGSDTLCSLFGWRGQLSYPRRDLINVHNSTFCNPNFPQVYCSEFSSSAISTCTANAASPVMCDSTEDLQEISGILIASNNTCIDNNERVELHFHSIEPFIEWIEEVSEANVAKFSAFLMLSLVFAIFSMSNWLFSSSF